MSGALVGVAGVDPGERKGLVSAPPRDPGDVGSKKARGMMISMNQKWLRLSIPPSSPHATRKSQNRILSDRLYFAQYHHLNRVEHFAIFAIASKIMRILTEHIEKDCSLESKLFLISMCSIRIINVLEVIAKTSSSKIANCSTLPMTTLRNARVITGLLILAFYRGSFGTFFAFDFVFFFDF